jgi:hypothetical protein
MNKPTVTPRAPLSRLKSESPEVIADRLRLRIARRRFWQTGLWTLVFLVMLDGSINLLFPYPANPMANPPNKLQSYFAFGQPLEQKLAQLVGKSATDPSAATALVAAGWLNPTAHAQEPTKPSAKDKTLVAIYGMSFANNMGDALIKQDANFELRKIAAPAAPPNYTFAAYQSDRGHQQADVVMFAVLASSVKAMGSMSGATWQFEIPAPYTYPRYRLSSGKLVATWPTITSLEDFRSALVKDRWRWQAYRAQLAQQDVFFRPELFDYSVLDRSAIVRIARRAWSQHYKQVMTEKIYDAKAGFKETEDLAVLRTMVEEFGATTKRDGKVGIVLLINDQDYEDHLFKALQGTLKARSIPYFSTHEIAPATNPQNFIPGDGHFTVEANERLSVGLLALVRRELGR